jgi:apolipoprotein N-acyltransferase
LTRQLAFGPKTRRFLAIGVGLVGALGHAPFHLLPLSLLGLIGFAWLHFQSQNARMAAWNGFWLGIGYFGLTMVWMAQPLLIEPERHAWMIPFVLVLMSGCLALFWAVSGWMAYRIPSKGLLSLLAWVGCLTVAELLRSYLFTGLPWGLIGHIWIDWDVSQLAAYIGPLGLTLVALLPCAFMASADRYYKVAGAGLMLLVFGAGALLAPPPFDKASETQPVIRIVQPNVPQDIKWDYELADALIDRLIAHTAAPGDPDVTIWPESAVPYLLDREDPLLQRISGAAGGKPVLFGIQRLEGERAYNSLVLLQAGQVRDVYDKHHLVPFGEYIPVDWLISRIGLQAFSARQGYGYSKGPGPKLMDLGPLGHILPLICYEAIFPQDLRGVARPDWLLQVTNDAWFGNFSGPYQHLDQVRLRAIEQGLPMVRVANTGVSAVIDPYGRVVAELALNTEGILDVPLPVKRELTLYAQTGDAPLALLLVMALFALAATARRKTIDPIHPKG